MSYVSTKALQIPLIKQTTTHGLCEVLSGWLTQTLIVFDTKIFSWPTRIMTRSQHNPTLRYTFPILPSTPGGTTTNHR
jgi:hypothetical protein